MAGMAVAVEAGAVAGTGVIGAGVGATAVGAGWGRAVSGAGPGAGAVAWGKAGRVVSGLVAAGGSGAPDSTTVCVCAVSRRTEAAEGP